MLFKGEHVQILSTYQYYTAVSLVEAVGRLRLFGAEAQLFPDLWRSMLYGFDSVVLGGLTRRLDLEGLLAGLRGGESLVVERDPSALRLWLLDRIIVTDRSLAAASTSATGGSACSVGGAVYRRKHVGAEVVML